jgi:hypothetical protein
VAAGWPETCCVGASDASIFSHCVHRDPQCESDRNALVKQVTHALLFKDLLNLAQAFACRVRYVRTALTTFGGTFVMNAFAAVGRRAPSTKPFWKRDAFWIVGMPTSLVGLVFLMAMIASAAG